MPDLGQIRNLDGQTHVFMRCYPRRGVGPLVLHWVDVDQFRLPELAAQLHALPHGAVIDLDALARHEVIVVSAPAERTRLSDEDLLALEREAEAMTAQEAGDSAAGGGR